MNNIEEASSLLDLKETETSDLLKEFYHKRHILVHGKMLPIIFKQTGEILLPVLSKNGTDITGWYHKEHSWKDIVSLPTLEVNQLRRSPRRPFVFYKRLVLLHGTKIHMLEELSYGLFFVIV